MQAASACPHPVSPPAPGRRARPGSMPPVPPAARPRLPRARAGPAEGPRTARTMPAPPARRRGSSSAARDRLPVGHHLDSRRHRGERHRGPCRLVHVPCARQQQRLVGRLCIRHAHVLGSAKRDGIEPPPRHRAPSRPRCRVARRQLQWQRGHMRPSSRRLRARKLGDAWSVADGATGPRRIGFPRRGGVGVAGRATREGPPRAVSQPPTID